MEFVQFKSQLNVRCEWGIYLFGQVLNCNSQTSLILKEIKCEENMIRLYNPQKQSYTNQENTKKDC
jgi:hypothetical protein